MPINFDTEPVAESVWEIYLKFMTIIFGADMPPILAAFTFYIFFIFVFAVVFWILKIIFCRLWGWD